jgi:hypothetical protein
MSNLAIWHQYSAEGLAGLRTAEVHLLLGMQYICLKFKSMLKACLFDPILYCCLKYVDFYIC